MSFTKLQRDAAQETLNHLASITTKCAKGEPLSFDELQAMRACADHAGREAAAALGIDYEGERAEPHDGLEWMQMLAYVADPF